MRDFELHLITGKVCFIKADNVHQVNEQLLNPVSTFKLGNGKFVTMPTRRIDYIKEQ